MVRKAIIGVLAGLGLALGGCATSQGARVTAPSATENPSGAAHARILAGASATDRFSSGNELVMNVGGSLNDSQDPIPIFPKDPSPVGGLHNPGNPGSSPLPSTGPVAARVR